MINEPKQVPINQESWPYSNQLSNSDLSQIYSSSDLFEEPIDDFLRRFMPTLKVNSSFRKDQFYETVKKLIENESLHIFNREKHDLSECSPQEVFSSQACLLYSKSSWAFNDLAISLIAQSLPEPCSVRRLLHLLDEQHILSAFRVNRDSYQNRLRVYFRNGNYTDTELYETRPESGIFVSDEKQYTLDAVEDGLHFHLGQNDASGHDMYWDFDNAEYMNKHMIVTGQSGAGKSSFVHDLLLQAIKQGITTVVFHHQGTPLSGDHVEIIDVYKQHPALLCFSANNQNRNDIIECLAAALQLTTNQKDIIDEAYEVYLSLGEQEERDDDSNASVSVYGFIQTILKDVKLLPGITPSIQRKFRYLSDLNVASNNILDWSKYEGKALVLDFRGNSSNTGWFKCYAELFLHDLFFYKKQICTDSENSSPLIIVSDEFQNMNTNRKSTLDKILRESRKFGISLWLASQLLENDSSSRLKHITDQSAMKVYFQSGTERSKKISNLLGRTPSEKARLLETMRSLEQREFVFQLNGKTPHKCIANDVTVSQ